MRIVCLSDTHDSFRELSVPDGDLLLHGGDLSRRGTLQEVTASANWLRSLPHPHKVVIARPSEENRCGHVGSSSLETPKYWSRTALHKVFSTATSRGLI